MKKYENFLIYLSLTIFLWLSNPSFAVTETSYRYTPEQLTALASAWAKNELLTDNTQTELSITALDNRVGEKECATTPVFSLPANHNARQMTLQITCSAPTPWQLFIPLRITEWLELVVAKQNINLGTVITADMLQIERRERRLVRGQFIQEPATIIGSRSRRSVSIGQIISLQELCLVCRGDVVTIQISNNGLSVSASGVAQQDGSLGDTVTVKNQQSGRNIQTEVVGVNQVRVKF